ncbi:hypothetical protein EVB91_179 [Rhizobium phage RHph_I1_18]|nr:hypothetical protein EVB91_179 [Rhizobium phage RHph_I1_18]
MITFKQHISESLSSTFPLTSVHSSSVATFAQFVDDKGVTYTVSIGNDNGTLNIAFSSNDMYLPGYGKDNRSRSTGTALKVYATIGKLVSDVIEELAINTVKFEAARPVMIPVYRKLADRLAQQYKGIVHQSDSNFIVSLRSPFSPHR